jgi:hypothetical protein
MVHSTCHTNDAREKNQYRKGPLQGRDVASSKILAKVYSEILSWPAECDTTAAPTTDFTRTPVGTTSVTPYQDQPSKRQDSNVAKGITPQANFQITAPGEPENEHD